MAVVQILALIAGIIIIGFLSEWVFKKTNIPDVLILILIGILIGSVLQWVRPADLGGSIVFATFALIFILFQGALNINFHDLIDSLSHTLRITVVGFVLTTALITIISYVWGYSLFTSLLMGTMLGGTASAVVVPLVNNLKMENKTKVVLMLESAITDVLCIVSAITVMNIMTAGAVNPKIIFSSIFLSFSLAVMVGAISGLLWVYLLHKFENLTSAYMVSIAAVLITYSFVEGILDANGAIAALSFGLVLGNSQKIITWFVKETEEESKVSHIVLSEHVKVFYSEIAFFVKVFFFVYLGIIIDFSSPAVFIYGGLLTIAVFLIRPLAVKLIYDSQLPQRDRTFLEVLTPKGLAPVVLIQIAIDMGVPGAAGLISTVLSVVLLSIVLTSILVFFTEKGWFKGFWVPIKKKVPKAA